MQNKYSNQRLTLSLRKNKKKCKESSKKLKNKPNQNCNIVMFTMFFWPLFSADSISSPNGETQLPGSQAVIMWWVWWMVDLGLICCFSGVFVVRNKENHLEIKKHDFWSRRQNIGWQGRNWADVDFFYINKVGRKQGPPDNGVHSW